MQAASTNSRAQIEESNGEPPSDQWSYEHTRILPEAFADVHADRTLNIFDAGPAEPRTIDFFRRFRCHLFVADLIGPSVPSRKAESARVFLDTVDGVRFDVCFLWDYVNYLDDAALADFVSVLSDHVHEKTRLYAIGAYSAELPLRAYRYAITDVDQVAIRPVGGTVPQPRSRNDVVRSMPRYVVHRAALRRDNRLELLLRTTRTDWS